MRSMTDEGEPQRSGLLPHQPAIRRAASPKGEARRQLYFDVLIASVYSSERAS
jgi:hypothetical protein